MLRAHQLRCAAVIGGYARTAEAHALVRSGWAHDLVATRPVVRARAPRVVALDDGGYADERDPAARTARLPSVALRAARTALERAPAGAGAGAAARVRAVAGLRPVPHHRPVPALHRAAVAGRRTRWFAVCRWCGRADTALRCARCGSDAVRAVVIGARRTAEELGRAFPGATVITSSGESMVTADRRRPRSGRRHAGGRTARAGRVRRGAAAGQLGAAGPPGPARRRGHAAALDGRRGAGAVPRRRRCGGGGRRVVHPDGAGADPVGSGGARRGRTGRPQPRSGCRRACTWPPSTAPRTRSPRCSRRPDCRGR